MSTPITKLDQDLLWAALADEIYEIYMQIRRKQWWAPREISREEFKRELGTGKTEYLSRTFTELGKEKPMLSGYSTQDCTKIAKDINSIIKETTVPSNTATLISSITECANDTCKANESLNLKEKELTSAKNELQAAPGVVKTALDSLLIPDEQQSLIEPGDLTTLLAPEGKKLTNPGPVDTIPPCDEITCEITEEEKKALWQDEKSLASEIASKNNQENKLNQIKSLITKLENRKTYWGYGNTIRGILRKLRTAGYLLERKIKIDKQIENTNSYLIKNRTKILLHRELTTILGEEPTASTVKHKLATKWKDKIDENWQMATYAIAIEVFNYDGKSYHNEENLYHDITKRFTLPIPYISAFTNNDNNATKVTLALLKIFQKKNSGQLPEIVESLLKKLHDFMKENTQEKLDDFFKAVKETKGKDSTQKLLNSLLEALPIEKISLTIVTKEEPIECDKVKSPTKLVYNQLQSILTDTNDYNDEISDKLMPIFGTNEIIEIIGNLITELEEKKFLSTEDESTFKKIYNFFSRLNTVGFEQGSITAIERTKKSLKIIVEFNHLYLKKAPGLSSVSSELNGKNTPTGESSTSPHEMLTSGSIKSEEKETDQRQKYTGIITINHSAMYHATKPNPETPQKGTNYELLASVFG